MYASRHLRLALLAAIESDVAPGFPVLFSLADVLPVAVAPRGTRTEYSLHVIQGSPSATAGPYITPRG